MTAEEIVQKQVLLEGPELDALVQRLMTLPGPQLCKEVDLLVNPSSPVEHHYRVRLTMWESPDGKTTGRLTKHVLGIVQGLNKQYLTLLREPIPEPVSDELLLPRFEAIAELMKDYHMKVHGILQSEAFNKLTVEGRQRVQYLFGDRLL